MEIIEPPELVDDFVLEIKELGELDELGIDEEDMVEDDESKLRKDGEAAMAAHLNPVFASPVSVSLGSLQPTQYNDGQL